ncbi:MAG: hypothetical protein WCT46_03575 [Candidatus Gracilibacteria bacterium]|jgi:hypothetical protein
MTTTIERKPLSRPLLVTFLLTILPEALTGCSPNTDTNDVAEALLADSRQTLDIIQSICTEVISNPESMGPLVFSREGSSSIGFHSMNGPIYVVDTINRSVKSCLCIDDGKDAPIDSLSCAAAIYSAQSTDGSSPDDLKVWSVDMVMAAQVSNKPDCLIDRYWIKDGDDSQLWGERCGFSSGKSMMMFSHSCEEPAMTKEGSKFTLCDIEYTINSGDNNDVNMSVYGFPCGYKDYDPSFGGPLANGPIAVSVDIINDLGTRSRTFLSGLYTRVASVAKEKSALPIEKRADEKVFKSDDEELKALIVNAERGEGILSRARVSYERESGETE